MLSIRLCIDIILAPETPSRLRSDGKNRKTDGVHVVGESPEVKQEGKTSHFYTRILQYKSDMNACRA